MSAFVLEKAHIDALVHAGLDFAVGSSALRWFDQPADHNWTLDDYRTHGRELHHETAERVGQMLWTENVRSVNNRYDTDQPEMRYQFSPGRIGGTISSRSCPPSPATSTSPASTSSGTPARRGSSAKRCVWPQSTGSPATTTRRGT